MGNQVNTVKSEIDTLFKSTSQAEFQNKISRILHLNINSDRINTLLPSLYIRTCIEEHFDQFSFLFHYLIDLIINLTKLQRSFSEESTTMIKNALLIIIKFIPVLYEKAYAEQNQKILWSTSNSLLTVDERNFRGVGRLTVFQVNEECEEGDSVIVPKVLRPNIAILLEALLRLCFWPGFTVLPLNQQSDFNLDNDASMRGFLHQVWQKSGEKVELQLLWRGLNPMTKYPNDQKYFTDNRILVLQCLIACFGQQLFQPREYTLPISSIQVKSPPIVQMQQDTPQQFQFEQTGQPIEQLMRFKQQNIPLLLFVSLPNSLLKELFISLWGTILCHKYNFFWFQDNALIVRKKPRVLAALSAQVLLFILSETVDCNEIARQIPYNSELNAVYQYLYDFQQLTEVKKSKSGEREEEFLQNRQMYNSRMNLDSAMNELNMLRDCQQVFKNVIREALLFVESRDFFRTSIERLMDNASYPMIEESRMLTFRAFDKEGVAECLGLLLFCYQNNQTSLKTLLEIDSDFLQRQLEMLIYYQVQFLEGNVNFNIYLLCLEIMRSLSRLERFSSLLQKPNTVTFPTKMVPIISGTFGDFLISLYSHSIFIHFQSRMRYFSTVYEMKPQGQVKEFIGFRPDILCLLLCDISSSIRNISQQSARLLAQAFYIHLNYDYLLQVQILQGIKANQDQVFFENFDLIAITINNILCSDPAGNAALPMELLRNFGSLKRLFRFKVGDEQFRLFFKKIENAIESINKPIDKRAELNIIVQKPHRPSSALRTENSEQLRLVLQLLFNMKGQLSQYNLSSLKSVQDGTQKINVVPLTEAEEQSIINKKIIFYIEFRLYMNQWEYIINKRVFETPLLRRVQEFLAILQKLIINADINPYYSNLQQVKSVLQENSWIGLMDRSLMVIAVPYQEYPSLDKNLQLRDFVLSNCVNTKLPYFDPKECLYFIKQ